MQFFSLLAGAYFLGSVPAAYLVVRWTQGLDIRKIGTGKVGASNVLSVGPKWLVIPVALFDVGKGALVVLVAKFIGLNAWEQVGVGLMAVVGHNWPIYLGFKSGGRGVFASLGVIFILSWKIGIFALIFPYLFAPMKQVALGVFIAYLLLAPLNWFIGGPFDDKTRLAVTVGLFAIMLMGIGKRLIGSRNELSKKTSWREIIINRLLFDRDISDRNLWISNAKGSSAK